MFLLLSGLLLVGGVASAQILIEGNVYGGGNIGEVVKNAADGTGNTTVIVNGGTIGDTLRLQHRVVDKDVQLTTRVDYGNVYGGGNGYKITGHNPNNNAPIFDINAGRVQGNTSVYVGGDAVVRRAVYGGGNMASVGIYTANNGVATYNSGGHTVVTVTGNALIGPKKTDLTSPTPAELDSVKEFYNMTSLMSLSQYADSAFKYLGANEGWVFGSSRGISGGALRDYSFVDTTEVTISGNAQVLNVFGSGENGHVQKGTNVIVKDNALVGGVPLHGAGEYTVPASGITTNIGEYTGATYELANKDSETAEDEFGVGREITRGNVLGGGKGTDFIEWFDYDKYCYTSGRVYGNTHVTVQDNARIYNRVYGGGLIAMVGNFTEEESQDPDNHAIVGIASGGHTYVNINGGFIGSPGSNGYNNGEVYGGSRGLPGRPRKMVSGVLETLTPLHQVVDEAYVGHTHVTVDGGTVMNNVYGGGANGHVQGNSYVTIKQTDSSKPTTIGLQGVGGWHGNVFAGGGGTARYKENNALNLSITAGRVFGDTYLEMTGGHVLHNVYGGGAIASVGTYNASELINPTHPYLGFGHSNITITGGEIGTDGDNNGMVFGSGRGQIAEPGNFLDYVTYVAFSEVNIGTGTVNASTGEVSNLSGNAKINGSVYGSGENGHAYMEAVVNVFGGTIGCTADEYDAMSDTDKEKKFPFRGNVYGAGCGTDMYDTNNDGEGDTYNPLAGVVQGNTKVNIYGGYISRSVYGAGAMASVGSFTIDEAHTNTNTSAALSWPYKLTYTTITDSVGTNVTTGMAEVNIRGGHIGTVAAPVAESGNVFGSARGDVGPLGTMETMAIVRETEVEVNFAPPTGNVYNNNTPNVIVGSVYGSGENGSVYENTKVTLANGLVRGSVFGGGDGTDTYMVALKDPNNPSSYLDPSPQRSITSGKVYGNTEVVINGGQVLHNVFGGGNLASVGKGSYMGYGEMSASSITPSPTPYENSGICTVTVNGGTIGTTGYPGDGYNNGFVFGSSKGTPFKTVNLNPRYDYSRDFFLGYVNKTIVNIGSTEGEGTGPQIKGSVFGGGDNGHVRWHTDVTVNKGEIGAAYVVSTTHPEPDSLQKWAYRGNVYGAGRGADMYDSDGDGRLDSYCPSAGSVTLNTNVTVNGGTIHRNVYGGGSMATVGPPPTGYNPGNSKCTVNIFGGAIGEVVHEGQSDEFLYGGNVYGAGRGIIDQLAPLTQYAAASNTEVNVEIGNETDKVLGNVYGGGSYGQVKNETNVNMKAGHVRGSVFGGGMGFETEVIAGLVAGNATVDMTGGIVERSIYGGGQMGSVGTFTTYNDVIYNEGQANAFTVQVPKTCAENTGLTTVKMSGGNVGLLGSLMPWGDHNPDDDDRGWIFCGGQGLGDSIAYPKAVAMGVVGSTYLEISNPTSGASPCVTASVYGGCENGLVLNDTYVKIAGGQIGTGLISKQENSSGVLVGTFATPYSETLWENAIAAVQSGNETTINDIAAQFHECDAWEYGKVEGNETKYYVYDYYANEPTNPNNDPDNPDYHTASMEGSNGHSFFGNVFGGGSGYYPIAPGVWRRTAGQVNGNTHVEITGGHILTNIYGGNETTDVKGKCTIEMSGGTLGVPRTIEQIKGHPVTCYLFGAGMGDTRTQFNKWTMVGEVEVSITGGTIFGSIFGGGEDGHVLGDVAVNVGQAENKTTLIGTWGRSYVDGNVFGGGRGFSGNALTAGVVTGDVDVNISGGIMLGSIYGGGRLASVGTYLADIGSTQYGQLIPDNGDDTHGHVTINITGGTIGNDYEAIYHTDFSQHTTGGHVFAGAMGRLTNLDNSTNPLWPNLGKVKETVVNISGDNTLIKGNVYGGGEFGTVETDATITVSGGTIMRDVYGGGYGSTDITSIGQLRVPNGSSVTLVNMTPMKLAGRVNGNTKINVEGGWIQKSVYGGGEMATVGVIKNDSVAHRSETTEFALSWPYKMNYEANTGKTEINVTGGRIGITGSDYMGPYAMINGQLTPVQYNDQGTAIPLTETEIDDAKEDNGDVYGGGKGFAAQRYLEAHANNVHDTHITVNYTSNSATPTNYKDKVNGVYSHDCITGAVYGGGENGHVLQNSNITLTNGLVGHNIYGGGKGKGLYTASLLHYTVDDQGNVTTGSAYDTTIYSITAGKVYGNTHVTMNGGYVVRNVYGGGNMASVGKGNYTGAPDDYSTTGYGECVTTTSAMADTLNSGNTFVTITGGQLGYLNPSNPDKVIKDGLPYGSVYGGCRGEVQRDVPRTLTPRIHYSPEDFLGYVNKTHVVIGSATGSGTGPRLYGSVYGGGQDGHVRWNTNITFNKGEIGVDFGGSELIANDETIQNDYNSHHWANRGNVYGAGSGIGQYTDENNEKHYSYISGSVTQFTNVEIKGGTIHNNVYGGGNLASVGPPRILQSVDCPSDKTGITVNIKGNVKIGKNTNQNTEYGGKVYGASRGIASDELGNDGKPKYKNFAYCSYTEVNVSESPIIYGAVFGGGENGKVGSYHENSSTHKEDGQNIHTSTVNINGGTIVHGVYGGGQGVFGDVIPGSSPVAYYVNDTMSGRVMGNATVNLMGGTIGVDDGNYAATVYGGCRRSFVWGNTLVNVGKQTGADAYEGNLTIYGSIFGANRYKGTPYGDATVNVYKTAHTAANTYPEIPEGLTTEQILSWLAGLPHGLNNFAIKAVYGGSDLVDYIPKAGKKATVNVFQCKENTIYDVYGGGNAAAVGSASVNYQTDANVNIWGGRMFRVFGGGNGEQTPADIHGAANTTINGGLINQVFGGSNNNGIIDDINLVINQDTGCDEYIIDVFGGGNSALIIGDVTSTVECCSANYYNYYGGSSYATIYGNVNTNIFGATFTNLFGGSKGQLADPTANPPIEEIKSDIRRFPKDQAELLTYPAEHQEALSAYLAEHSDRWGTGGNVTLNIFGGKIENAFGGSDVNGVIDGQIQVNVFEYEGNCALDLTTLYGAGRNTPYTPNYAINTSIDEKRLVPEINHIHGTVKDCVYGGGHGLPATTTANPMVNIGYYDGMGNATEGLVKQLMDTIHNHYSTWTAPSVYLAQVEHYVYGGGEMADIIGNPTINVRKSNTVINSVYGGGKGEDGFLNAAMVHGSDTVRIYDGLIERNVFGGGEMSIVTGDTKVEMSGGTVGSWQIIGDERYLHGTIYGGGQGSTSSFDPNTGAMVESDPSFGRVMGNTYVNISGNAQILKDVFGGGQIGSVGSGNLNDNTTGVTHVTISGGQIGPFYEDEMNANVFGGSQGSVSSSDVTLYTNHANVDSTSVIVCGSAHIAGSVFGGSENGHVLAGTRVLVEKGNNTNNSTPIIGTDAMNGDGCVFGGGQGSGWFETIGSGDDEETVFHLIKHSGRVGGNTTVEFTAGTVLGCIYGGGKLALTGVDLEGEPSFMLEDEPTVYDSLNHGLATINISGTATTVGENTVYSTVLGITDGYALLDCDYSVGDIFGGGRGDYDNYQDILAGRVANTSVNISGSPRIYCTVFGGGEIAGVGYWDEEEDTHPFVPKTGASEVTIEGSPIIGTEYEFTNEWYWSHPVEWTMFDTINNVRKLFHTCSGNVFGASQGDAAVTDSPSWVSLGRSRTSTVNINMDANGHIMSSVFGGAEQGTVIGDTYVNITGGTIGQEGLRSGILNSNGGLISYGSYNYGNVFGGGFGVDSLQVQTNDSIVIANDPTLIANVIAGRVYGNTHVNITGGAIRGNVFGGGNMASVGMWTNVLDDDDNVIDYAPVANTGEATVNVGGSAIIGPMDGTGLNAYVYGGGRGIGKDPQGLRKKYCNVNSTHVTIGLTYVNANPNAPDPEVLWNSATDGRIYGSVYGGGSDCHVLGNTSVTLNSGIIGTYDAEHNTITDWGGNIFGGGQNFLKMSYSPGRVAGNTNIEMNGGYVYGSIFGGGRNAVTGTSLDGMKMHDGDDHGNTCVKVKGGTVGYKPLVTTFTSQPIGDVYGAGKGTMQPITGHPAASPLLIALVKNTEVEISQPTSKLTRVLGSVYGGGEVGNVGRYTWTQENGNITEIALASDGHTDVTVKGGRIGVDRMEMSYQLVGGSGNDKYNPTTNAVGNVFGGGRGLSDDPATYGSANINTVEYGDKYLLDLMASAGSTTVTIENTSSTNRPWVKGSVYGGSASGHVLGDTEVNIDGGQIGSGNNANADELYEDDDFLTTGTVHECYHWDYNANDPKPFDLVEIYNGITGDGVYPDDYEYKPTDGKTWFGNVFGGGSGFLPYVKNGVCVWNPDCGKVYGNSTVTITGGHILSSVYGGSETSDVGDFGIADATYNQSNPSVHEGELYCKSGGTATVIMSDGTVGVPRTTQQIKDYPVPGYLFGAGKGDSRNNFNPLTNVNTTSVTVKNGAKVFGSVLGGAEEGHVIGNASVVIEKATNSTVAPVIGSTGFSGYDGHVFGGGWGDKSKFVSTPELTYNCPAGRVGGKTFVTMTDGTVLGNVYGGGYVARVGVGVEGEYDSFISGTGASREYDSINHGETKVEVKGGIVGNFANNGLDLLLSDQKVGNVYGGGRGSADEYHEDDLGRVAKAIVNITSIGDKKPTIYGSVFGGGQMANVGHWNNYASWYTTGTGHTEVNITGAPSIGTPKEFVMDYATGNDVKTQYDVINNVKMISHTRTGNVFGGGQGDMKKITGTSGAVEAVGFEQGHCRTTTVTINMDNGDNGGHILGSVFGGSEQGAVWGNANVNIAGGTIGQEELVSDSLRYDNETGQWTILENHATYSYGSVFGGSYGMDGYKHLGLGENDLSVVDSVNAYAGRVYRNTHVSITGGAIRGNVFGGGNMASVGQWKKEHADPTDPTSEITDLTPILDGITNKPTGKATVSVSGSAIIGPLDMTGLNAYVYGGGKGIGIDLGELHKSYGNVNSTKVTVNLGEDGHVYGSLFGGGSDGHVLGDAEVNFNGGLLGTWGTTTWDGNIFGGGRNYLASNITAGRVGGNITVNMRDGTMLGNIYGGGRLASTGVDVNGNFYTTDLNNHGNIIVNVTGGTIGYDHLAPGCHDANDQPIVPLAGQIGGSVFGGAMGEDITPDMPNPGIDPNNYTDAQFEAYTNYIRSWIGWVRSTKVTVGGLAATPVLVKGCVFGGGKSGRVKTDTEVTIEGNSTIGVDRGNPASPLNSASLAKLKFSGSVYGAGLGSERSVALFEDQQPSSTWPGPEVGRVYGNASVYVKNIGEIKPKILNNIYGGGALSGLGTLDNDGNYVANTGSTYVEMSGGELGPLDMSGVNAYVFAGGQGQPSYDFKDYGKVNTTHLVVKEDARVYGSLFGGGEDGHVVGSALIDMNGGMLGTTGETTWDGNIFGGGRNFSAQHETTGRVGGNVTVNVREGELLGSVFGGGRLGSVGVNDLDGDDFAMQGGDGHGFITVNIGGDDADGQTGDIVIGHTAYNDHDKVGGNVYGGGKGIAGAPTSNYPKMAQAKETTVNIKEREGFETWIEGSVFGSGEDGHVTENTFVNIFGGQIGGHDYGDLTPCADVYHGNVYGGGRGLDTWKDDQGDEHYSLTAGKVFGNSNVRIYGGHIIRNVYGGGNIASVGDYRVTTDPNTGAVIDTIGPMAGTGLATVRIKGGTVGLNNNTDNDHGNVFGSSHGIAGHEYKDLAFVHNTLVEVDSVVAIYGSVFGGGEDGHVTMNTVVNVSGGTIGFSGNNEFHGNVYGGGRGIDKDEQGHYSPTAGEVYGKATVNIQKNETYNHTPTIYHNVYGGGSASVVHVSKVVNVAGGNIIGSVFGGSRHLPEERENKAPRFVNMWGGTVDGDVYGCSYQGIDGDPANDKAWASFINLSGGTVKGSVYGAGYQGEVKGSVGVLIGKNAIEQYSTLVDADSLRPSSVTKAPLDIKGNVYAGSNFLGSQSPQPWRTFDITGYSNVYIDGKGYKTGTTGEDPEMIIGGGLYGSGTNCESGAAGRDIVIRNYGERNMFTYTGGEGDKDIKRDSLTSVTRTLTTIQRVGNLFLDKANIALTGARDISNLDGQPNTYYGVYQVDTSMVVSNGSSIVLGNAADPAHIVPAYIDSVKVLRSVRLDESIYGEFFLPKLDYTWIGVKDTREDIGLDVNLYYYGGPEPLEPLDRATEENVIIFKGLSQLFVRYHIGSENKYGELQGFFRMSSPYKPRGTESFAYARQKVASAKDANKADGGFASYFSNYNFFTDNGEDYTKTKQYPYTNIIADPVLGECRGWFIPDFGGHYFYVDGTGTRNGDNDVLAIDGGGRFPDMPKLTIVGSNDPTTYSYSIMGDASMGETSRFNSETDIIYVVGAVSGVKELVGNTSGKLGPNASHSTLPLRLYRYPGGHKMSNNKFDGGAGYEPTSLTDSIAEGPGPWYGTLLSLDVESGSDTIIPKKNLVMDSVMIDGLYGVTLPGELNEHLINVKVQGVYNQSKIDAPLVTVKADTIQLKGNTELKRGYNNHDALANVGTAEAPNYNFYVNPDFDNSVINGGGVYVAPDASANVQVEGIVTITGNKQKKGNGTIESNVYLPTFQKHIEITNQLDPTAVIGVTSPNRNTDKYFWDNTLSPVAKGVRLGSNETTSFAVLDAKAAWTNNNFRDDQNWFFSNGDKDTYYLEPYTSTGSYQGDGSSVYFGWTWGNVVRTQPSGYVASGDNITISSEEGLAWLISQTTDLNGAPLTNFSGKTISLAQDLNLKQYVWVPVGSEIGDAKNRKFSGTFDGRGHLIDSLAIEFLSKTDRRYQRSNYGLFGDVNNGRIDRTFVVRSVIVPDSISIIIQREDPPTEYNIGGLAGYLEGTSVVSNSEAAITIRSCDTYTAYAGGLVGELVSGEIHSSMAMPDMTIKATSMAGGLVGRSSGGNVYNSFVNAKFVFRNGGTGGGLLGTNGGTKVRNCYVALYGATPDNTIFDGLAKTQIAGSIDSCYVQNDCSFVISGGFNKKFTPVSSTDTYGYMYLDNTVPITEGTTNVINKAMFQMLNHWVDKSNKTTQKYAHWTRPTLHSINGDLPVLMLCNYDGAGEEGQGDFRSLATFKQGVVLQYGGTVRDGSEKELSTMLGRNEYVFVYGDVTENLSSATVEADKVAIYEHAAILNPGKLGVSNNTYVGVTFDNTSRSAVDAYGDQLDRDWHMFSTPLSNAPLGINYEGQNTPDGPSYNHWTEDTYIYHDLYKFAFYAADDYDGYFPSKPKATTGTSGSYGYPYDFYCWYEPDWQWINFKRNGPSHWHHDVDATGAHSHDHIDYQASFSTGEGVSDAPVNVNEETLVPGKGYQMAIQEDTYMQSHGNLNNDEVKIRVKYTGGGWGVGPLYFGNNLIGNPYHAYLDFESTTLAGYYVYDADTAATRHVDYLIYPTNGSVGGCYASRYIHPHQGFFIQTDQDETITFEPSMTVTRKDVENAGFRDEQPAYPLVNLFAYDWEDKGDVLVVEFNRPENGGGIKSKSLRSGNHLVFAHHGDDDYGAFFAKEGTKQVPVRFQSFEKEKKPYTFRWNLQNGDFRSLYLIDNLTGIQYDMLRNDSYSFEASKQDYLSRFLIVFDVTDVEEHTEDINFAFFDGSTWVVNGKGRLEVVDVLGRVLHAETLHGDQNRVSLDNYAKGIYLLRLWEGDTPKIQKIIMH